MKANKLFLRSMFADFVLGWGAHFWHRQRGARLIKFKNPYTRQKYFAEVFSAN